MSAPDGPIRCTGCRLLIVGGTAGCLALYQDTLVLPGTLPAYTGIGRLAFDTYCVQHPDRYCISAKSLVAHLGGLCYGLEYRRDRGGYELLRHALDGPFPVPKPPLPAMRGALTIADIAATPAGEAQRGAIQDWAQQAWDAYADFHAWARAHVHAALARH